MGLLMSSAFRCSLYILPIPMFDRRDHPSVPPTTVPRLDGWALMTGQLGGAAVPRRRSRVRGSPLDPTTLYSVRPTAGDHDASCASDARLPGGWDHSFARLEAHGGLRFTTHLGRQGPPD